MKYLGPLTCGLSNSAVMLSLPDECSTRTYRFTVVRLTSNIIKHGQEHMWADPAYGYLRLDQEGGRCVE